MVKLQQVLRQNLVGNDLTLNHLKTRFRNGWFFQESQSQGENNINKQNLTESCNESSRLISSEYNISNCYPISVEKNKFCQSYVVSSNSLWFYNKFKHCIIRNKHNVQPICTLKTYTYHTLKSRPIKKKTNPPPSNVFEKLRKMYRETVKLKVNKTIMKKKKPCHLSSELINETMFNGLIKEKSDTAKEPLTIDPVLANHLLKQAAKKESPDPNVSLNSAVYPYITCPLKKPENYVVAKTSACTYQHTSLAPLFAVDNLIINKEKKPISVIDNKPKCINFNFWCQYATNDKNDDNQVNKSETKPELKTSNTIQVNSVKNEIKKYEPKQVQNESKLFNEVKPVETFQPLEIAEKNKTFEPKNPLNDSKNPIYIGKYYSVKTSEEIRNPEQRKLTPKVLITKAISNHDIKSKKHLNLNFPYQMTCPNQLKKIKKAASETNLIKRTIIEETDKFPKGIVNMPKYNSNKFCKQLKKYYTSGNTANGINNIDKKQIKHLIEKIAQQKTTDKTIKIHIPLTSPNNQLIKNKEKCKS